MGSRKTTDAGVRAWNEAVGLNDTPVHAVGRSRVARSVRVSAHRPPTHAAAVSGCTGTGEEWATPEHTDEWGWCSWYECWVQLSPEGRTLQTADELPGCTATTAVLEGEVSDG